ncbi:MarR family transcriptional regulator [Pilimelia anulata]|uniref:MarR family transcriptional regulator n=1 Tax=Pilimelia anulata TaxID=53371 RepID=A0A8J3BA26_9ACTN|nr:MarR family transcriptional regulator [Pilimelia anulata]GGJ96192.1 MarR family transcriptional regulator [Pilimelia anulata]
MAPSTVEPRDLAITLRDAITRLNRRVRQARPVGDLTVAQLSALTSLELAGDLTPGELADAERVRPPTMTRIIAKLAERGLVERRPHPTDGRQAIIAATAEGRAVYARFARVRDEWLTRRLRELTDAERTTLVAAAAILRRLARD